MQRGSGEGVGEMRVGGGNQGNEGVGKLEVDILPAVGVLIQIVLLQLHVVGSSVLVHGIGRRSSLQLRRER